MAAGYGDSIRGQIQNLFNKSNELLKAVHEKGISTKELINANYKAPDVQKLVDAYVTTMNDSGRRGSTSFGSSCNVLDNDVYEYSQEGGDSYSMVNDQVNYEDVDASGLQTEGPEGGVWFDIEGMRQATTEIKDTSKIDSLISEITSDVNSLQIYDPEEKQTFIDSLSTIGTSMRDISADIATQALNICEEKAARFEAMKNQHIENEELHEA